MSIKAGFLFTRTFYPNPSGTFAAPWFTGRGTASSRRDSLGWLTWLLMIALHSAALAVLQQNRQEAPLPETLPKPVMVSIINAEPATPQAKFAETKPNTPSPKANLDAPRVIKKKSNPPIVKRVVTRQVKIQSSPQPEATSKQLALDNTTLPSSAPTTPASHDSATGKTSAKPKVQATQFNGPSFNAAYLHNPAPRFPAAAKRRGEQGKVLLKVMVSAGGQALSVALHRSSGSGALDEAALAAVRNWRFVPATRGGQPVSAAVVVPIKFSLGG